ncbi:MAG TPA: SlyX family protein [Rudaea sp.]
MDEKLEQRLAELETRIAFLDHTVQTLDATVATQDRLLRDIRDEFLRLRQELSGVKLSLAPDARDEPPPPHY